MWRSSTSSTHPGRSRTSSSWLAPSKLRRTTIVGSEKMVVYDDTSNEPVRVFVRCASPPAGDLRRVQAVVPHRRHRVPPYRRGRATFARVEGLLQCRPRGAHPRSSSVIGLEVVRMMEAVDRSLARGARESRFGTTGEYDSFGTVPVDDARVVAWPLSPIARRRRSTVRHRVQDVNRERRIRVLQLPAQARREPHLLRSLAARQRGGRSRCRGYGAPGVLHRPLPTTIPSDPRPR